MNKQHQSPVITRPYRGYIETMATYFPIKGEYQFDYHPPEVNSLEKYNKASGKEAEIISWEELSQLQNLHKEGLKEPAKLITKDRFWEMLEILPPSKWHNAGGIEVFHISERLTDNLVSWFAHNGDKYAEATDCDNLTDKELRALFGGVL